MRTITHIVVHCSATGQDAKVEAIQRYWKQNLGWKSPGYHYIIEADGKETQLLSIAQPSNGVKGFNKSIINVCYIGGVNKLGKAVDNRTDAQKKQLYTRLKALKKRLIKTLLLKRLTKILMLFGLVKSWICCSRKWASRLNQHKLLLKKVSV